MNKTIKENISGSPFKGIIIISIVLLLCILTMNEVGAENEIINYIPTIEITLIDNTTKKDYLVQQNSVVNIKDYLNVTLKQDEILNKHSSDMMQDGDVLEIYQVKEETKEVVEEIGYQEVIDNQGLNLFTTEVTQKGKKGKQKSTYKVTYYNDKEVSRELLQTDVVQEPVDKVISTGVVQPGAYFTGRMTTYGGDCNGCSGRSACGISLNASGVNGNGSAKLTYKGKSYYCLAADASIPFGTIIEITNHNLNIETTAYGIVVDRGGAIKGNKIDIFNGSENGKVFFHGGTSNQTKFKIISVGSGNAYFWK